MSRSNIFFFMLKIATEITIVGFMRFTAFYYNRLAKY